MDGGIIKQVGERCVGEGWQEWRPVQSPPAVALLARAVLLTYVLSACVQEVHGR